MNIIILESCALIRAKMDREMDQSMDASLARVLQRPAIVNVPDLDPGCELRSRWIDSQNIAVYSIDKQASAEYGVYEIQWKASHWNSATRKLVHQSYNYFMGLQETSREEGGRVQVKDLLKYSRLYRSVLHECVLGLGKMARDPHCHNHEYYSQESSLYAVMELVWHLCEVLFIEVLPAGCLVQQLLEWVCWHAGQEKELLHSILMVAQPEEHPEYWRMVYRLVLSGRMQEARDLLSHHSFSHTMPDMFSSIDELLRKAPMVRATVSLTRAELHRQWQEWKGECGRRRDGGDFMTLPQLHLLCRVLCGEEEAFRHRDIIECFQHWYELMVGRLLFTSPLVVSTDYDLIYTAENCSNLYAHEQGSLDDILLAALRNDVMEVIKLSSSVIGNWWFVAHLTNLLHHRGQLVASQLEYGSKLSEFLLLEYASSLMPHQSLWQVALDYYSQCPTQGRHYMAVHLEHIPLSTQEKALKVVNLCEQYQLKEQAHGVCRVQAMKAYRQGKLGVALSWCIRAKDSAFAAFLAEKYFDSYQSLGEFMDLDLLDHLGDAMLLTEKLMFLSKYREFHQLYENAKYVAAGKLLMSLLGSNTVPKRFWPTLLTDALQLLEKNDVLVYDTEQTFALSHFFQQINLATSSSAKDQSDHHANSQASLLRLALTRNLARAMLAENIDDSNHP